MSRPINEIAQEIVNDWGAKTYFGAKPYLSAMLSLRKADDMYGYDTAHSIICYFLGNAGTYRGETAKRVKAELKQMVGLK